MNNAAIFFFFHNRESGLTRTLVHSIESVVIEWSHQIRDVLKRDSSQLLLDGQHPNPFVELNFWKDKLKNLECVYNQVCKFPLSNI